MKVGQMLSVHEGSCHRRYAQSCSSCSERRPPYPGPAWNGLWKQSYRGSPFEPLIGRPSLPRPSDRFIAQLRDGRDVAVSPVPESIAWSPRISHPEKAVRLSKCSWRSISSRCGRNCVLAARRA